MNGPLSADDAVRIQDSLENLAAMNTATTTTISCSTVAPFPAGVRTASFRSLVDKMMAKDSMKLAHTDKYGFPSGMTGRHLRFASQSDSEMALPPVCEDSETDEPTSVDGSESFDRTDRRHSQDSISLHKRIIKALFKTPRLSQSKKSSEFIFWFSFPNFLLPTGDWN